MTCGQRETLELIESSMHVLSADIMMDSGYMIVETRQTTYLVDTDGTVTREWRNTQ